jgi:hypothetical protein
MFIKINSNSPNIRNSQLEPLRQSFFNSIGIHNLLTDTRNYKEIYQLTGITNSNKNKYFINIFQFLNLVYLTIDKTQDVFYKNVFKSNLSNNKIQDFDCSCKESHTRMGCIVFEANVWN